MRSYLIGRAGVPMEVMGLMLGEFVDDYTITCVDVFAMPQVSISWHFSNHILNCPISFITIARYWCIC
jgi:hypothetical protein